MHDGASLVDSLFFVGDVLLSLLCAVLLIYIFPFFIGGLIFSISGKLLEETELNKSSGHCCTLALQ